MADNTFLGLQPYTEDDAYRFKGRTEESQELFRLIVRNDFTVCYAESGEGKTSLLNAGVFPLLRENMNFPIAITFTSDDYKITPDSFDAIIDRCIKDSIAEYNEKNKGVNIEYKLCSTDFQGLDHQAELQRELRKHSWWKLRNYRPQAMGLTFTPVFVFDQFEEVFNLPGSIVWIKKFFDWLEDISSDSCPEEIVKIVREIIGDKAAFPIIKEDKDFKAVFSLRKEFIGELDYWGMQKCFIPGLKDNRYCLKALTYEGAKKVMTQQERFDEDKVEQVLTHFVGQYSREPEKTIAENLPVIPALLLSVVCDSWEKDISSFAKLSTDEISQSLNKILEKFYDDTIDAVIKELNHQNASPSDSDVIRKDIDVAMFDLVDVNGKRVRVKAVTTLGTISMESKKRFNETLPIVKYKTILNQHRIIKITKIDGEDYVEIVHDSLCPIIAKRREMYLAKETEKREKEKLRAEARKKRTKVSLFLSMTIAILSLLVSFYIFYQNNLITKQNRLLLQKEKELAEADSLNNLYGEFGLAFAPNITKNQKRIVLGILNNMVTIQDRKLWISQFEFTIGQWYGILDKSYDESLKNMPMTNVSYADVFMFIIHLQDLTNVEFGLPSVEEWEYAAKGGENTMYSGSDDVYRVAWFKDNSGGHAHPCDGLQGHEPNMFDIYNMSGNVGELCNTTYNDNGFYTVCGGDFNSSASDVTITSRKGIEVNERSETIGFRLVVRRTPIKEPCKGCSGTGLNGTLTCPVCGGTGLADR